MSHGTTDGSREGDADGSCVDVDEGLCSGDSADGRSNGDSDGCNDCRSDGDADGCNVQVQCTYHHQPSNTLSSSPTKTALRVL